MAAKVLIAHGDTAELQRLVSAFAAEGLEPVATPDGGDAFARFFEEDPDLVVCSSGLPVLAGRNFLSMIQSQSPETRVVLLEQETPPGVDLTHYPVLDEPVDVPALLALFPDLARGGEPVPATTPAEDFVAAEARAQALAMLRRFQGTNSMLRLLDDSGIERLAAIAIVEERDAGARVITQGEHGSGFYLLGDGQVSVTLLEAGDEEVARIGAGEFFGEIALLSEEPRSASVWTTLPSTLLWFARAASLRLLDDYPALREALGGVALQRTEENIWRALYDDNEVQRSLAELAESLEPELQRPKVATAPVLAEELDIPIDEGEPGPDMPVDEIPRPVKRRGILWPVVAAVAAIGVLTVAVVLWPSTDQPSAEDTVAPSAARGPEPLGRTREAGGTQAARTGTADDGAPTVESEPALAPQVAPTPRLEPQSAPTIAVPTDRKALRRMLMQEHKSAHYPEAIAAGVALREHFALDWEAELTLAHALRLGGDPATALAMYTGFLEMYPTNAFADDVRFWAAELWSAQGEAVKARPFYEQVAADAKSNFRTAARERLENAK